MPPLTEDDFFVGPCLIQPGSNQISGPEGTTQVEPKVMQLLLCLARQPGVLGSRDALHSTVWPDVVVSDKVLTGAISKLRKAFGDDPNDPEVVETISKGGYRLIAPVSKASPNVYTGDSAPAPELAFELPPPAYPAPSQTHTSAVKRGMLVAAVVLVGSGLSWLLLQTPQMPAPAPAVVLTSYPAHEVNPVLSPDGDEVAFAWNGPSGDNWDLYVKRPGTETPLRLTTAPAHDLRPTWRRHPSGVHPLHGRGMHPVRRPCPHRRRTPPRPLPGVDPTRRLGFLPTRPRLVSRRPMDLLRLEPERRLADMEDAGRRRLGPAGYPRRRLHRRRVG